MGEHVNKIIFYENVIILHVDKWTTILRKSIFYFIQYKS